MGQKNPVHVYKLVTVGDTIEEKLLETLASKQELADASIDMSSDVTEVAMVSGMEDLKRRLEVILDPMPVAAVDESQQRRVEAEAERLRQRKENVSAATSNLITAALSLAGELIPSASDAAPDEAIISKLTDRLSDCVEKDDQGRPQLTITLPDQNSLRSLATTLAKLLDS